MDKTRWWGVHDNASFGIRPKTANRSAINHTTVQIDILQHDLPSQCLLFPSPSGGIHTTLSKDHNLFPAPAISGNAFAQKPVDIAMPPHRIVFRLLVQ